MGRRGLLVGPRGGTLYVGRSRPARSAGLRLKGGGSILLVCSLLAGVLALAAAPAHGAESSVLLAGPGGQFQPAVSGTRMAWEENTRARPNRFKVYSGTESSKTRVNRKGTSAANGGIDGSRLVYQEWKRSRSDLWFFNVKTHRRSSPPKGVNTASWEYWPSESGDWLLFGRRNRADVRKIILFNLASKKSRVLDKVRAEDSHVAPGQVNGDYATWYRCTAADKCDVFRYRISKKTEKRIPDGGMYQRAPSVSEDGTVYFTRAAGKDCEVAVRLMRYREGQVAPVVDVPFGQHIGDSYVDSNRFGNRVFFDRFKCGSRTASNIYSVDERDFPLSVAIDEPGSGTVTSDRGGLDCQSTCEQDYAVGTQVALTATPQPGYVFAGWSGAGCGDAGITCNVTMDGPVSVTASFEPSRYTLSVGNSGGGTVTSDPDGIDCGSTCEHDYPSGSEVALTATPESGYEFVGWSGGGCGDAGATCTVTLDGPKSVTATFQTERFTLTVINEGGGTVTSSPSGIRCGDLCVADFEPGTLVRLEAHHEEGFRFDEWEGDCRDRGRHCDLVMDRDRVVTADFDRRKDDLSLLSIGSGEGVTLGSRDSIGSR